MISGLVIVSKEQNEIIMRRSELFCRMTLRTPMVLSNGVSITNTLSFYQTINVDYTGFFFFVNSR